MKMKTAELCTCCGVLEATEVDPHCGDVCAPCRHALEHVGLSLVSPIYGLRHPPELGSGLIFFPNN